MDGVAALNRLLESDRWNDFFKSVASSLQVCISLIIDGNIKHRNIPQCCLGSSDRFVGFTEEDMKTISYILKTSPSEGEFITNIGNHIALLKLRDDIYIAVWECACRPEMDYPDLKQRAVSAQKLLSSFLSTLRQEIAGGERALELSTLRQINHIVLAMFHGRGKTLESALDLILSAIIIMLDAKASWLEYNLEGETRILFKGDRDLAQEYLHKECNQSVLAQIKNSIVWGSLGVVCPEDRAKASSLIPSMAQECLIVFEIEYLLKLMESQLSRILGSVNSGVLLYDKNGVICYVNGSACKLLSLNSTDLMGLNVDSVGLPWTAAVVEKTQYCIKGTMDKIASANNEKLADWQVCPIIENGEVEGWLVIADDRTDYYRWLEAGNKAERMAATISMVSAISHELRGPISAARNLVQLMGQIKDPHKVIGYTGMVLREIDRVTCLLNEFLLLGKPSQISPEPLDLASLLKDLTPILSDEAEGREVRIVFHTEPVPPILADLGQLTHVILKLTRNAIESAGINGRVDISLKHRGDWTELSVEDNGPGIEEDTMDKLFEPFFAGKEQSTGLGLSTVQAIVNNHGGRITASNAPEGGAIFTAILPSKRFEPNTKYPLDVMIVVPDDIIRNAIDRILHMDSIHTYSTRDLSNAFSAADIYYPHILILDKSFMKRDSIGYIKRIWPSTKLLILGEIKEGFENLKYISLPIDYSKLIGEIRQLKSS